MRPRSTDREQRDLLQLAYTGALDPEVFMESFFYEGGPQVGGGGAAGRGRAGAGRGAPGASAWMWLGGSAAGSLACALSTLAPPMLRVCHPSCPCHPCHPHHPSRSHHPRHPQGNYCGSADMGSGKLAAPADSSMGIPVSGRGGK